MTFRSRIPIWSTLRKIPSYLKQIIPSKMYKMSELIADLCPDLSYRSMLWTSRMAPHPVNLLLVSKAPPMHPCSTTPAIRSLGWNSPKMAMRLIGSVSPSLDGNGHSSRVFHRAKVILYDLAKNVRFTITEQWDRSPSDIHACISARGIPSFTDLIYLVLPG